MVERKFMDVAAFESDEDLTSLHDDPRWAEIMAGVQANRDTALKTLHVELLELFEGDQADRSGDVHNRDWTAVIKRDIARRTRALELLEEGAPKAALDFYYAAMVLQHSMEPEHYKKAHELAKKAADLDPTLVAAKWLSAAAWDRYLRRTDQPQVYGTQFGRGDDGYWTLDPMDREAVTDDERRALNVPVLAAAEKRVESMNAYIGKQKAEAAKKEADADEAHGESRAGH